MLIFLERRSLSTWIRWRAPCLARSYASAYPNLVRVYPAEEKQASALHPQVDVIAVHGLGADPKRTWLGNTEHAAGKDGEAVNWLEDLSMLPSVIPTSRIFTFNYESNWLRDGPIQRLPSLAEQLLSLLSHARPSALERSKPLIFVGHSFGGLVVQQAVMAAHIPGSPFFHLADATSGALFLGTPHRGTELVDYALTITKVVQAFDFPASDSLLKDLAANSEVLHALVNTFTAIARTSHYEMICCFEQKPSDLIRGAGKLQWLTKRLSEIVVDERSACIDGYQRLAIAATHGGLNKFNGPSDGNFQIVSNAIRELVVKSLEAADSGKGQLPSAIKDDEDLSRAILGWLAPVNPNVPFQRALDAREPGTGTWLVEEDLFKEWHTSADHSLFWLEGKAGSGKTMAISSAIESVQQDTTSKSNIAVAYFFCSYRNIKSLEPRAIFGSFIAQLSRGRPEVRSRLEMLYHHLSEDAENHEQIPLSLLEEILSTLVRSYDRVFLFLSELSESTDPPKVLQILQRLVESCPNLKLFLTSLPDKRADESIRKSQGVLTLVLTPEFMEPHIRHFIVTKLESVPRLKGLDGEMKIEIAESLLANANGMYRWVKCQLEDICEQRTGKGIMESLKAAPKGMQSTYLASWVGIDRHDRWIAESVLRWLIGTRRPLKLTEVAEAIAISPGAQTLDSGSRLCRSEDLLDICKKFVVYDDKSDQLVLAHSSVKQFFLSNGLDESEKSQVPCFTPSSIHRTLAEACLTYLCFREFRDGPCERSQRVQRLAKWPLLQYASQYWPVHVNKVDLRDPDNKRLCELIDRFFATASNAHGGSFVSWVQNVSPYLSTESLLRSTPLYFACTFGLTQIVEKYLPDKWKQQIGQRCGSYNALPLFSAVYQDHKDCVRLLLEAGADPSASNSLGESALDWAAIKQNTYIERILKKYGAGASKWSSADFGLRKMMMEMKRGELNAERMQKTLGQRLKPGTRSS